MEKTYVISFCFDQVLVELKAAPVLTDDHRAQDFEGGWLERSRAGEGMPDGTDGPTFTAD